MLVITGRTLNRQGQRKFRVGSLDIPKSSYDAELGTQFYAETVDIAIDSQGEFSVEVYPATNGAAWIGRLTLVDLNGRPRLDSRVLPSAGAVDFFSCPIAVDQDSVVFPEGETPIFVSDYNKPGGPLQLTDEGTIGNEQVPSDFLRVDDERIPELRNYVTKDFYNFDQDERKRLLQIPFTSSTRWEYDHGLNYRPLVATVESDGSTIEGDLSYPVGTTKVVVDFEAPTSGVMILR